ncbi:unnamed protein product [Phytophthora lilii]|uniref:Unnamed protein product n=1 Tax=Phytophthora lilii TaxID=2077276 RepID=A0A9W6XG39_9STRA|nr:unnamed protein product [Phytophthora lilii]
MVGPDHWLEGCPTATENQQKKATKSFLDNKRRDKETTTLKHLVTGGDIDVREVVFNDLVAMPYCLDNGTTHNIIPRSMVEELQLLDSSVNLKQLEPPVRGKAVGGAYITCTEYVELDIGFFQAVEKLLEHAATLAFPDPEGTICMINDTSNDGWSIIVSLVKEWSKATAAEDQQHDLLYCMSGSFHGASQNWSIVEKEGYPRVCACSELDYAHSRQGLQNFH